MTAEAMTPIVRDALALAHAWQDRANDLLTDEEKAIQAQMQRLMDHPMDKVADTPHRIQDRRSETFPEDTGAFHHSQFHNEPDSDWSCPGNRRWAEEIRRRWENRAPVDIPLVVAGNTVIFKPASAAALAGWELCQCLWRAGVSRHTLQFVPCSGDETGAVLTTDPDVDAIILTGGTDTGLRILQARPGVPLAAETGGKNATIVTAMADRDQAVKNVIQSAFGNAGQKCSATSLLILEKEVYGDDHFKAQLVDAASSFRTGSAWRFRNRMGPLVHRPGKELLRALTTLEPGETWALKPRPRGKTDRGCGGHGAPDG
jgi:hypothetical protein